MTSNDIIEKVQFAVKIGLVNPQDKMFDEKNERVWESLIGPEWRQDILLAIYDMAERQVEFIDTFGHIHPN